MNGPFDAVVFDFSGVMVASAFHAMARVAPDHPKEDVLDLLMGPYHEDTDHHWHRVERGEISIFDWVVWVQEEAERRDIPIDLSRMQTMMGELVPQEPMLAMCRRVRDAGMKTSLLTNNVAEGSSSWRAVLPLDDLFDDVVDSSAVGMRKPNPDIFHLALERLGGIAPDRAVFLDDAPGNIDGARTAGLHTILVDDTTVAAQQLEALVLT